MADRARKAERHANREAFRALAASVINNDVFRPSASSILDCLNTAQLSEDSAMSAELLRQELYRESPDAPVPEELSDAAVRAQLARAAQCYAVAALEYVCIPNLRQAFRYFRRATRLFARAAESESPMRAKWTQEASTYANWAVRVRQEHARRRRCRRKFSLGLLRR